MGVTVYPAQGGDGFKLRRIITTTGLIDLGQARDAYVVIAGGGGGGSGADTAASWSGAGGGGAGALGGSMLIKEFHATIGAGGTAGATNTSGGDGGNTYMTFYGGLIQNTSGNIPGNYIVATGGQGGQFTGVASNYTNSFDSAANPTISGWANFRKLFGSSGAGGGYKGSSNVTTNNPMYNYSSELTIADANTLQSWTPNTLTYYFGQNGTSPLASHSNFSGFNSIGQRPPEPLMGNSPQNTTNYPMYTWNRNSTTGTYQFLYAGAQASNGGAGLNAGGGYWTGGGASADSQGAGYRGAHGGSSRVFRGGLGGAANGSNNGGSGGGAGICAPGGNGGDATAGASGISGVGGLGGGGGAGGNKTGTAKAGGAGGQGAIALYW